MMMEIDCDDDYNDYEMNLLFVVVDLIERENQLKKKRAEEKEL